MQVCVEVLRRVHSEAVARDAGILFLGDFWHVRGALPVEPLNAALHEMRAWTQPTVMLPGNHDQVRGEQLPPSFSRGSVTVKQCGWSSPTV